MPGDWREDPGPAAKQIRPRETESSALGSPDRMTADERPRSRRQRRRRFQDVTLGAADVGHDGAFGPHRHHLRQRRGLVQGGVLMTFADRTCGITARYVSGKPTLATVQLDTHFVEAGKIGEVLVSKPHVVRSTRSLIFITTEVTVDKRCIAMASGVFKILKCEG